MSTPVRPGNEYPGAPRWVKVFAIVMAAVAVVVLFVAVSMVFGLHSMPAGGHGR